MNTIPQNGDIFHTVFIAKKTTFTPDNYQTCQKTGVWEITDFYLV